MNEHKHGMTGAWAVNALDAEEREQVERYLAEDPEAAAEEREQVERYLAEDPEAAAEARSFEETAGELAASLPPLAPPPALKSAVMARIATTRQLSPLPEQEEAGASTEETAQGAERTAHPSATPAAAESDRSHEESAPSAPPAEVISLDRYRASVRRSRWTTAAAALMLVTTIAGVGLWNSERVAEQEARASLEAMASEQAAAEQQQKMVSTILTADDATQLSIPSARGGSLAVMYSLDQQAMIVQAADLPELSADETYQLWMIHDTGPITSAGLLEHPQDPMMLEDPIPAGVTIGLTIEPAGGSDQPSMEPIASEVLS